MRMTKWMIAMVLGLCLLTVTPAALAELALEVTEGWPCAEEYGDVVYITVGATGAADNARLSYAWYYADGTSSTFRKSSLTGNTYEVKMTAERNGRRIYCVAKDQYGNSAKSDVYKLYMESTGPAITKQPKDVTVEAGSTAKVSVSASGEGLKYRWYYANKGADTFVKSSVTKATYSVTMNNSRAGRRIYCVVTDSDGNTVTSDTVTLKMESALSITQQPENVSVGYGETAAVSVSASGAGLKYRWYYANKGSDTFVKSSVTKATYSVTMNNARAGRQVYCVVTDANGNTVTSDTVTLNMESALQIIKQPASRGAFPGKTVTVRVVALGLGLTYKWYYCNHDSDKFVYTSTFKGSAYSITMNESRANRRVYCEISDAAGNTIRTNTVTLPMMLPPLTITQQPQSVTVASGEEATVSVAADGYRVTYQWYYKNAGSSVFTLNTAVSGSTYTVTMNDACAGQQVYCLVTDGAGNDKQSETVTLNMEAA